jgi:hypothetical protein
MCNANRDSGIDRANGSWERCWELHGGQFGVVLPDYALMKSFQKPVWDDDAFNSVKHESCNFYKRPFLYLISFIFFGIVGAIWKMKSD